jgi:Xaa-Pro dipeptidase
MDLERLERLASQVQSQGLDCLALVPGANLFYLTGLSFHLGDRPTVAFFRPDRPPALILPALETLKLGELPEVQLFPWTDEEGFVGAFRRAGSELGLAGARIGVEAFTMRVIEARLLEESAPGCRLLPADGVVSVLRMRKDAEELDRMRRAAGLAQDAMAITLQQFRPGMIEREVAAILKIALLEAGAQNVSFDPIVSGGPNSANPHASPSDRPVGLGEYLLFDWGVYVDGYASDITRTFPVGEMEPEMRRIYELVQEANAAGRAAVRPGVTCSQVDAAARQVIEQGGYGERFTHRTGHGLGLQVHEPPFIVAGNEMVLEPGMTFTIEPGIYLPGRGGVRIEDDVVVTRDGCESLTTFARDWTPIPG